MSCHRGRSRGSEEPYHHLDAETVDEIRCMASDVCYTLAQEDSNPLEFCETWEHQDLLTHNS